MRERDLNDTVQDGEFKQEVKPAAIERMGKVAIYGVAIVGGWFLNQWVELRAENNPWPIGTLLVLAALTGVGFYKLQDRRAGDSGKIDRSWIPPMAIVAVFSVLGFTHSHNAREYYVRPYCEYGAQSAAQLNGCMSHVTSAYINRLDTQAAHFARGDNSECLADSGPFCQDASKYNTAEPPDGP